MSVELTTVVGQLNILAGDWHNDTPNQVAVRQPQAGNKPGAGKGDLFVLTELRGKLEPEERLQLEERLAQTIRDSYYLARGSITASLRRALQAASDLLYRRNQKVDVPQRVIGGAVVLAITNEDAFLAQVGPAACYALLGDYHRRYPAHSAWLNGSDSGQVALGISPVVEPNLHHLHLGLEDVLVLADTGLVASLSIEEIAAAVSGCSIKTATKNLGQRYLGLKTRPGSSPYRRHGCSALALAVVEETKPVAAPAARLKETATAQLGKLLPGTPDPAPVEEEPPAPAKTNGTAQPAPAPKTAYPYIIDNLDALEPDEEEEEEELLIPDRGRVMASTASESGFSRLQQAKNLPLARIFGGLGAFLLLVLTLPGRMLKAIIEPVLPQDSQAAPRQAGLQARPQSSPISWVMLRNIAILIPILVAIIVGVNYMRKGRLQEAEYEQLLTTAQEKYQQSQAVGRADAISLMGEAEHLLGQAEQIKPGQPEIADLRQQMAAEADRLGNVQRLYYLPQLRQYTDSGTDLQEIVVQGVEIFVMDGGNNRVFHHRLDDAGEALLADDESLLVVAQGQAVEDLTVETLLGMTWMPSGGSRQTSDLLMLNSTGLMEYNPNWGLTVSAITGRDLLVYPRAVSSYFGNFYILDPEANTLLRYWPTDDGYSAPPEEYFVAEQKPNLAGAVDFAIDGAIYILYNDGRIEKYLSGEPVGFSLEGLDKPFNNPVALFTAPDEDVQHLYVADAGNRRIVQLNKDGSFVRQFKPRQDEAVDFANLQDIYVDEIGGRLFVLDSNNLYLGTLPSEQATTADSPTP